jgi:hypothetical protein
MDNIIAGRLVRPAPGGVSRMVRSMSRYRRHGVRASTTGGRLVDIRLMWQGFSTGKLLAE